MTGSVAMLERSVYNWLFGIRFTLDGLQIKPCLPKEYAHSEITLKYLGKTLKIKFNGYGNQVVSAAVNGEIVKVENNNFQLHKNAVSDDMVIVLEIKK